MLFCVFLPQNYIHTPAETIILGESPRFLGESGCPASNQSCHCEADEDPARDPEVIQTVQSLDRLGHFGAFLKPTVQTLDRRLHSEPPWTLNRTRSPLKSVWTGG